MEGNENAAGILQEAAEKLENGAEAVKRSYRRAGNEEMVRRLDGEIETLNGRIAKLMEKRTALEEKRRVYIGRIARQNETGLSAGERRFLNAARSIGQDRAKELLNQAENPEIQAQKPEPEPEQG